MSDSEAPSARIGPCIGLLLTLACVGGVAVAAPPTATTAKNVAKRPIPPGKRAPASAKKPAPPVASTPATAEVQLVPLAQGNRDAPPEFTLGLADDRRMREVRSTGGKAHVAPGVYWLTNWSIAAVDVQGRKWRARGGVQGMPPSRSRLELRAGQRVRIPLGTPLGVTVTPRVQGRTVKMTMSFFGSLGDRCYDVSVDAKRPPRPSVAIVDAFGKVVDRLDFSFG